ncbi:MAG: hypothetical protein ACHP7N_12650 [Caulobacterales bacterium]
MTEIRKFSLVYDATEDRLAWDTEDLEGATTRLWLTQRLCRGLVNALIPILQKAARPSVDPRHEATVQSFEQAAAMAGFGKVTAVRPQPQSVAGLVRAVNVAAGDNGVTLTFDFAAADTRVVGMDFAALRQTLAVMHRLHVAAGWPADFWPAWVSAAETPVPTDARN